MQAPITFKSWQMSLAFLSLVFSNSPMKKPMQWTVTRLEHDNSLQAPDRYCMH